MIGWESGHVSWWPFLRRLVQLLLVFSKIVFICGCVSLFNLDTGRERRAGRQRNGFVGVSERSESMSTRNSENNSSVN